MASHVKHGPFVCVSLAVAFFGFGCIGMMNAAFAQSEVTHQCTAGLWPECPYNGGCDIDNGESCGGASSPCKCI